MPHPPIHPSTRIDPRRGTVHKSGHTLYDDRDAALCDGLDGEWFIYELFFFFVYKSVHNDID